MRRRNWDENFEVRKIEDFELPEMFDAAVICSRLRLSAKSDSSYVQNDFKPHFGAHSLRMQINKNI